MIVFLFGVTVGVAAAFGVVAIAVLLPISKPTDLD